MTPFPRSVLAEDVPADIRRADDLGMNRYVCKPGSLDKLVASIRSLVGWWFETVRLPNGDLRN